MGIIGFLGKMKQQQAYEKKISFELQQKIDNFYNLMLQCNNHVKKVNNIYWCAELNLDFQIPGDEETKKAMSEYLSLINDLDAAYHGIRFHYSEYSLLHTQYEESIEKMNLDYKSFFIFIADVAQRVECLRKSYPKCNQFLIIQETFEKSLENHKFKVSKNNSNSNNVNNQKLIV